MPRPKRSNYYMDEVDWSGGCGYGSQADLPSDFLDRKLGLEMARTKRLAKGQRTSDSNQEGS
jgi:hypothetical protein